MSQPGFATWLKRKAFSSSCASGWRMRYSKGPNLGLRAKRGTNLLGLLGHE